MRPIFGPSNLRTNFLGSQIGTPILGFKFLNWLFKGLKEVPNPLLPKSMPLMCFSSGKAIFKAILCTLILKSMSLSSFSSGKAIFKAILCPLGGPLNLAR